MREETVRTDITVVGGGLSGLCAAVAAARLGRQVALVHNRPVLGGNSSSEVRVWVSGASATGVNRYARETGIMGELYLENQFRNPEGNPYIWDLVLLELARAESPNLRLFLNTDVHEVEASGGEEDRRILSVTGWMMGSERRIRFESALFLDCTGDGLIGFLAGAKYRIGREARGEYNESLAPEAADDITLGSTLLFYTKDAGRPVKFVPPSFAKDIAATSIPMRRIIQSGDSGCHYWWIEWGGELDTVHENERIRDELWAVIYGIWDYIKNSGAFDAGRLTLEWVGAVPGKREYRRFVGDYVLTQNDIEAQTPFADRVAFGGWSIDLHPPEGMYSAQGGSKHLHPNGIYHIPFRCLYSANVGNLLFAGRNISATHVAFGTTRVMATCAAMGEAAGVGAALCAAEGLSPRELGARHEDRLRQALLRQDASLIGIAAADPADLAPAARIRASGWMRRIAVETSAERHPLETDAAVLFPVDPQLDEIELLADVAAPTRLQVELWSTGRGENYIPGARVVSASSALSAGRAQWIRLALPWRPETPQNAFVIVRANPSVALHVSDAPLFGVLSFVRRQGADVSSRLEDRRWDQPVVQWSMKPFRRRSLCFRAAPETRAYEPACVADGYLRPFAGPHLWLSGPMQPGSDEWIELAWDGEVRLNEIHLVFNDDVNEYLNNLHFIRTEFEAMPELVRDYRLEARIGGQWVTLVRETDRRRRRKVHRFTEEFRADRLRLYVESTNGCPQAGVFAIRAFGPGE